jgi:hypothetical protein
MLQQQESTKELTRQRKFLRKVKEPAAEISTMLLVI